MFSKSSSVTRERLLSASSSDSNAFGARNHSRCRNEPIMPTSVERGNNRSRTRQSFHRPSNSPLPASNSPLNCGLLASALHPKSVSEYSPLGGKLNWPLNEWTSAATFLHIAVLLRTYQPPVFGHKLSSLSRTTAKTSSRSRAPLRVTGNSTESCASSQSLLSSRSTLSATRNPTRVMRLPSSHTVRC